MKPKILAFAGSARKDSFNKKLLKNAAAAAEAAGGEATVVDFRDLPMPLYDAELEEKGFPDNVKKFKKLMLAHQGLLISAPEYNSSITPLLKNALDWASRPEKDEESLACYKNKVAALVSASPGALGGLRGLVTLRAMLGNIGVLILPAQVSVPKADQAFNEDGSLKDLKQQKSIENLASTLVKMLKQLNP